MPRELLKLNASEWAALSRERTVFFFTLGPIEDHGPHLPVGQDLYEARALVERLAARVENELGTLEGKEPFTSILMPDLPLSATSNTHAFALTVPSDIVKSTLLHLCLKLRKQGFRHFACVTGHLGAKQLAVLEEVGRALRLRDQLWGLRKIFKPSAAPQCSFHLLSAPLVTQEDVLHSPLWFDAKEHGGSDDTSIALYLGLLSQPSSLPEQHLPREYFQRAYAIFQERTAGYWGNPAKANASNGEKILSERENSIFGRFRATLERKADPLFAFRTWYAAFPPNRTAFKFWIWALVGLVLLWLLGAISTDLVEHYF